MPFRFMREFIRLESASGILLCLAAILGLIFANSPLAHFYYLLLDHPWSLPFPVNLNLFTNDALMVLFFFLVGLEVKREILIGELNTINKALLPGIAAMAGMLVPALIYLLCNHAHPLLYRGWAIPTATDIAFALGILNLLGKRIPLSLKIFLTALAIFDDMGAVTIIAVFYTQHLVWLFLFSAGALFLFVCVINHFNIRSKFFYIFASLLLWFFVLKSGVHPTVAGVLAALTIPLDPQQSPEKSLLRQAEQHLHPWVAFFVLPLFAFVNTSVNFQGFALPHFTHTLILGIALGLFAGKQLGVFSAVWAAVKLGWAPLPRGSNWRMIYGIAILCGVGFTMSLFIGDLAFAQPELASFVRLGILAGSLASGVIGYIVLRWAARTF